MTTDLLDVPCPECGLKFGDHTVRDAAEHRRHHAPFESTDEPIPMASTTGRPTVMVDIVDVLGTVAIAETPSGPIPIATVVFRFSSSANDPGLPQIAYACDEQGLKQLRQLIGSASDQTLMALNRARKGRG